MAIELRQQLKLTQQLVMTPQLQQAIKLLQLTRMELSEAVREELMENPLLEDGLDTEKEQTREEMRGEVDVAGDLPEARLLGETELPQSTTADPRDATTEVAGDAAAAVGEIDWESYLDSYSSQPSMPSFRDSGSEELPSLEARLTKQTSLVDHLTWQLKLGGFNEKEVEIGLLILGNLDHNGYLIEVSVADLAAEAGAPEEQVLEVLDEIQQFDPVGVASRSLKECLLIQARHLQQDDAVLVAILENHFGNLEKKNYAAICKDLDQPLEEIIEAVKVIASLDPKPGREYATEDPQYITPDVYVHKVGDKYFVVPNDDGMPKLKISSFYRSSMAGSPKAKQYIQEKLRSAQWLIRSIQQRQRTIVRVTESILKFQLAFFEGGIAHLKPLILRDVAEDISMHESTISRVATNKYVHTPQGLFELKFFFNAGIHRSDGDDMASIAVKRTIRDVCGKEDPKSPYSDQQIVTLLSRSGISIARRTVAKYRDQLGLLSSSKRRQLF